MTHDSRVVVYTTIWLLPENGVYSPDWIKIDLTYIDSIFDKLVSFYRNYCSVVLNENVDEPGWNYDDYFKEVFRKTKDLKTYHGC